ncbi:MAG: tRNA (adenosine(37)-N6)-threonylcarbamoyltransferase complex dimerization subunit type 1 TsaB [Pseudomonadota bacterium]
MAFYLGSMSVLAIDTCANNCAAAVFTDGGDLLSSIAEDIGRGHAERLNDIVANALAASSQCFNDLSKIIVAVGPGSFTGIRVGVAAARGYAIVLGIPVVGISTFSLLAAQARASGVAGDMLVAFDGGRGQVFAQRINDWPASDARPFIIERDGSVSISADTILVGNGGPIVDTQGLRPQYFADRATGNLQHAFAIAQHAPMPPEPIYLRKADAQPSRPVLSFDKDSQ